MKTTKLHKITIEKLSANQIDAVLSISDAQLGRNYISKNILEHYLAEEHFTVHVAIVAGEVVAFSLMIICSVETLAEELFAEEEWIKATFENHQPTGYPKMAAVKTEMWGMEIGSRLLIQQLAEAEKHVHSTVGTIWKTETGAMMGRIVEKTGMKPLKEVPHYWSADSLAKQYLCPVCGTPPCQCTAVIYAKFF